MENTKNDVLLRTFAQVNNTSLFTGTVFFFLCIVALLGIAVGYMLAKSGGTVGLVSVSSIAGGGPAQGAIEGSNDLETFKDSAEGILREGGVEGEGQYHLERPGGESQNAYLTSSLVDLSKYKGKKIKVWGQTQAAKKAGWLMDVGRVQVL